MCPFKLVFLLFSDIYPVVELIDHVVVFIFNFLRDLHTVLHNGCTFPPTVYKGSISSTSLPPFVVCVLFDDNHSDRCEVLSHCDFDLHFPVN